jgi:hypothetical protein
MMGSGAEGASGAGGAQDAPEGPGLQDSPVVEAFGDGIPAMNTTTAVEAATSLVTSEAVAGDPATWTSLVVGASSSLPHMAAATASVGTDNNTVEELKVIMGHPGLRASGTVSLSEAMGTTHFALN